MAKYQRVSDEEAGQVAEKFILHLSQLPGFPQNETTLISVCCGVAQYITWNQPVRNILARSFEANDRFRLCPETLPEAWDAAAERMDLEQNDIEYLAELIRDTCETFPTMPEMFRMYSRELEARGKERYLRLLSGETT